MAEPRTLTTAKTRLTTAGGATYIYDGDGNRVEKCTAGTTAGTCAASPTGTLYWMDVTGGIIAESDLSGNLQEEYIFFGRRIARREVSNGAVHYYFADFLGSTSLVTDANGAMSTCPSSPTGYTSILTGEEESDFYPYGGEIKLCDNSPQHFKFTGKERDQESGLDEMVARYYSSSTGRFLIPDWSAGEDPIPYAQLTSPQTLNLYGYVMNNPVSTNDPTGHFGAPPDPRCGMNARSCMPDTSVGDSCEWLVSCSAHWQVTVNLVAQSQNAADAAQQAQNQAQLNIQVIRSDNLNNGGQAAVNGQLGDMKADMAKIGIGVNITSDSTRSNIDLKNPGSFDKGAIPYFFVTSKEAGSSTSGSGFFGKKVGVVINEFTNGGDKVVATHETLHILRGDIYAGKNGASWGRELHVRWETFKLEHGWTRGMGWLTDAARNPPNQ